MTPLRAATIAFAVASSGLPLAACDVQPNYHFQKVTQLVEVRVRPNPVVAGDSVTIRATIRDSTIAGFDFRWRLESQQPFTTRTNQITVASPTRVGTVGNSLTISHPTRQGDPIFSQFFYQTIARP